MKTFTRGRVLVTRVGMRMAISAVIGAAVIAVMPARTEAQTTLPEVTVTAPPQRPPRINDELDRKDGGAGKSEAGGKGDGARSLEQLNKQLKRKVEETKPVLNTPPLDARSGDTKTGVINIPGVQQQYGKNFGNSVIPYRPNVVPAPPLGHR